MNIENRLTAVLRVLRGESAKSVSLGYPMSAEELANDVKVFLDGGRRALAEVSASVSDRLSDLELRVALLQRDAGKDDGTSGPPRRESWGAPETLL